MKQEKWITVLIGMLVILGAGTLYLHQDQKTVGSDAVFATELPSEAVVSEESPGSSALTDSGQNTQIEYAVYICGAVKHPGVYRFTQAARVCDVVEAAGGFTKNAAEASINQARYITDGEQIEIATRKQWKQKEPNTSAGQASGSENISNAGSDSGKVNLNTATETELMTLSGVGQSKAKAIIDYRTQNGAFGSVEDIMQVPGIKEGVYNQIKDSITV